MNQFKQYRPVFVLALLMIFVLLAACERKGRDLADAKQPLYKKHIIQAAESDDFKELNLHSLPGDIVVASIMPLGSDAPLDGQALYNGNCSVCHQQTGLGVPGAFPPLVGTSYVVGPNVERLAAIMLYGLQGEIVVNGVTYNGVMTQFSHLSDDELSAIATYIRSAWGNSAPEVSKDVFAAQRAKYGSRAQFSIAELGAD